MFNLVQGMIGAARHRQRIDWSVILIGDFVEGGYYFGDYNGYHMICSPTSGQTIASYGREGHIVIGADSTINGHQNTLDLVSDTGHPATDFCAGLTINGFDDWYLPSSYEVIKMYNNYTVLNSTAKNFYKTTYWSSTERDATFAERVSLLSGGIAYREKHYEHYCRAIRRVAI